MTHVTILRWSARILSVLILLFWGFFIVAHHVGDAGRPSRPLNVYDYVLMASTAVSLVGLAVAWKWELAGGLMTLVAFLIGVAINRNLLMFPIVLIPITAVLYVLCWWTGRS